MSKYVLLRLAEDDSMLLIDRDAMTVDEITSSEIEDLVPGESFQAINAARDSGQTVFRGVDTAIVASQRSQPSSFPYLERQ